jgi:hypothetical protein
VVCFSIVLAIARNPFITHPLKTDGGERWRTCRTEGQGKPALYERL